MGLTELPLSVHEDRLVQHRPEGNLELPLPYRIHPRFVQNPELAELLAERLSGRFNPPIEGARLRVLVPRRWGLLQLDLPYAGLDEMPNPQSQIRWEVECHAPESVHNYLYDYQEHGSRTRVLAVRRNLVSFLKRLAEALGAELEAIAPQEEALGEPTEGISTQAEGPTAIGREVPLLRPERAEELQELVKREEFRDRPRYLAAVIFSVLVLAVALAGAEWIRRLQRAPATDSGPAAALVDQEEPLVEHAGGETAADYDAGHDSPAVESSIEEISDTLTVDEEGIPDEPAIEELSQVAAAESAGEQVEQIGLDGAPGDRPDGGTGELGIATLLHELSRSESRLPDFMVLDRTGLLVRGAAPGVHVGDLLPFPSRVSHVGRDCYWIHFDRPLAPARQVRADGEAASADRSLQVARLEEAAELLDAGAISLVIQRLSVRPGGGRDTRWRFAGGAEGVSPAGWRLRVFHDPADSAGAPPRED